MSWSSDWVESNVGLRLNDEQKRCVDVLVSIGQIYNIGCPAPIRDCIEAFPTGLSVLLVQELSSYDNDALTALVVAAHRERVRVSLSPWYAHDDDKRTTAVREWRAREAECDPEDVDLRAMELTLHARSATGSLWERHPGLEGFAPAFLSHKDTR